MATDGRRADAPAAYRRASDLIQQQIAQKPQDPDLRTRHALYLVKMGDRSAALKETESVAAGSTLTSQMLYRLTVVYELAGDRPRSSARSTLCLREISSQLPGDRCAHCRVREQFRENGGGCGGDGCVG